MPLFEFQCDCGYRFEELIVENPASVKTHKCAACGGLAAKQPFASFAFAFATGTTPGNSGVDSVDANIDHQVGRNAALRWEAIKDREAEKRSLDVDDVPITRTKEGYAPLDRAVSEHLEELRDEYDVLYTEHVAEREAKGIPKFEGS